MPIYEYGCQKCGKKTEAIQRVGEKRLKICPHCGGGLKKLASAPAIQFKGSGWYVNDYARGNKQEKGERDGKSEKSEKGEKSESEGKSERTEKSAASEKSESGEKSEKSEKPAEKKREGKEKKGKE